MVPRFDDRAVESLTLPLLGGWSKYRLFYVVMVVKIKPCAARVGLTTRQQDKSIPAVAMTR
jgi:hypothetical protein